MTEQVQQLEAELRQKLGDNFVYVKWIDTGFGCHVYVKVPPSAQAVAASILENGGFAIKRPWLTSGHATNRVYAHYRPLSVLEQLARLKT